MVSGNIGSSTLKRLDYTVIGDVVNVAARLQEAASVNQILITAANHEKIRESFQCKEVGVIGLKNKKEPIKVYEVVCQDQLKPKDAKTELDKLEITFFTSLCSLFPAGRIIGNGSPGRFFITQSLFGWWGNRDIYPRRGDPSGTLYVFVSGL